MRRVPTFVALLVASGTFLISSTVPARAASEPAIDDELHLQITFSLWATSIDGSMTVKNLSADLNACFSELIHDADYAFNPGVEITKGNWLFVFDMTISKISDDQKTAIGTNLGVQSTIGAWDLLIGYTVFRHRFDNGMTLA